MATNKDELSDIERRAKDALELIEGIRETEKQVEMIRTGEAKLALTLMKKSGGIVARMNFGPALENWALEVLLNRLTSHEEALKNLGV